MRAASYSTGDEKLIPLAGEALTCMAAREYPIKDYAVIGNCETAALINVDGGIDWLCLPAFNAVSFFGALLDRERDGAFFLRPAGAYTVERRYLEDTAILETRFVTARGILRDHRGR